MSTQRELAEQASDESFRTLLATLIEHGITDEEELAEVLRGMYEPLLGDKSEDMVQFRLEYVREHKLAPWTLERN